MEAMVPTIIDRREAEIQQLLEMLVRAYDPCISCSTHYLDVEFVDGETDEDGNEASGAASEPDSLREET
jgi:coenzyme F420-reducing hydrogenase alpha subunit